MDVHKSAPFGIESSTKLIFNRIMSNLKLSWAGDLESLKNFVSDNLKLKGAWKSTGGEKQVFTSGTISITWLSKKKFLSFNGLSDSVKNKLWAAVYAIKILKKPITQRLRGVKHYSQIPQLHHVRAVAKNF